MSFSHVDASVDATQQVAYLDRTAAVMAATKEHLLDLLGVRAGQRVLDMGCGAGHDLLALSARSATAMGVDLSRRMAAEARGRAIHAGSAANIAVADGAHLPFAPAVFDACRIERVLQHVAEPGSVLRDVRRVLRRDGRLVVFEPDWGTLAIDATAPACSDAITSAARTSVRQPRIGLRLRAALIDAGFHEVTCTFDVAQCSTVEQFRATFPFDRLLVRAAEQQLFDAAAVRDLVADLQARSDTGRFWATLNRTIATARA